MNALTKFLRWATGATAEIAQLTAALAEERALVRAQLNALAELDTKGQAAAAQIRRLASQKSDAGQHGAAALARAQAAETALARAQHYLADLPPPSPEDVDWTKDDASQLAAFLETAPAGKKLAQHLSNRLADYERAAVLYRSAADMPALLKRAHGFRDCRGEIRRLSAAGPSPAKPEAPAFPLPDDLENLRG